MRYLDYKGLEFLIGELKALFVQKESGKELSSNDFTDLLKDKMSNIEEGAEKNVIESVNSKTGKVVITSDDIEFLSSITGVSETNVSEAIDKTIKVTDSLKKDIDELGNVKSDKDYVDRELAKKVDAIDGEGLSDNNLTDALREKLEGIEDDAQRNVIELIKRNGANLDVTDKSVDIKVPKSFSDLVNDMDVQTKSEVLSMIEEVGQMSKKIVVELPLISEAEDNTMYLILNSSESGYKEYIVVEGEWEKLGDTSHINLEDYLAKDEVKTITNDEIDLLLQD